MHLPTRMAVLLCTGWLGSLSGCAPMPVRQAGITVTISTANQYRPPAGALPAPLSTQPGSYDYAGIVRVLENGQTVTPQQALGDIYGHKAMVIGQIVPVSRPLPGRLHIVVPDHDRLRLLALQRSRGVQSGATEFQAEVERVDLHEAADAVIRSRAFASADIVEQNDTVWPDAAGADAVLWYQVQSVRPNNAGPWVGTWQMRRADAAAPLVVSFDPGTPPGPARLMSFVRSLQDDFAGMSGASASPVVGRALRPGGHPVSFGSGIAIDLSGHVLTDSHVIAGCPDIRVSPGAGQPPVAATLVANDPRLDLALLKTGARTQAYASFRDSQSLRPGESLVATGFPLSGIVSADMAVTTGSLTAMTGLRDAPGAFQFSAPVQPGNSGGPVLDSAGRVVGVAVSVLNGLVFAMAGISMPQNVNFATKANVARDYLARFRVAVQQSDGPAAALDAASVADIARRFTVRIECWH